MIPAAGPSTAVRRARADQVVARFVGRDQQQHGQRRAGVGAADQHHGGGGQAHEQAAPQAGRRGLHAAPGAPGASATRPMGRLGGRPPAPERRARSPASGARRSPPGTASGRTDAGQPAPGRGERHRHGQADGQHDGRHPAPGCRRPPPAGAPAPPARPPARNGRGRLTAPGVRRLQAGHAGDAGEHEGHGHGAEADGAQRNQEPEDAQSDPGAGGVVDQAVAPERPIAPAIGPLQLAACPAGGQRARHQHRRAGAGPVDARPDPGGGLGRSPPPRPGRPLGLVRPDGPDRPTGPARPGGPADPSGPSPGESGGTVRPGGAARPAGRRPRGRRERPSRLGPWPRPAPPAGRR